MRDMKPVLDAMLVLINWEQMLIFCENHGCKGCPYMKKQYCDKVSTETVLKMCASTFREFIEEAIE